MNGTPSLGKNSPGRGQTIVHLVGDIMGFLWVWDREGGAAGGLDPLAIEAVMPGYDSEEAGRLLRAARAAAQGQDWDLARDLYASLQQIGIDDYRLIANQAEACWFADQPQQAHRLYSEAAGLAPADPLPWRGLGNALRDLNRFAESRDAYQRSLDLAQDPLTAWNASQLLIGLEDYEQAFRLAEARFDHPGFSPYRPPGPFLEATFGSGRRLVLWTEQGFGDSLQYLRWCVPLASQSRHRLVLELEPALLSLFRLGLSWLPSKPRVRSKGPKPTPLARGEQPCSLMSLPHHFGAAPLSSVFEPTERPGHWSGYLRHPSWPLAVPARKPRVGLVWAAGRKLDDPFTAREYRKRSLPPDALGQLILGLRSQAAELVALQIGPDHALAQPWRECFEASIPQPADFAENARWIRQLDLLISVDTASVHLAGALGHPCWTLLPYSADPRWLRDRSDSPWYPSLRLFRQPESGQWQPVIEQILEFFTPWWHSVSG